MSPTFKLNLPSEVAAANLGRFLNTDFQLKKFGSDVSWKVSIAKRRNKDKHEYLLVVSVSVKKRPERSSTPVNAPIHMFVPSDWEPKICTVQPQSFE